MFEELIKMGNGLTDEIILREQEQERAKEQAKAKARDDALLAFCQQAGIDMSVLTALSPEFKPHNGYGDHDRLVLTYLGTKVAVTTKPGVNMMWFWPKEYQCNGDVRAGLALWLADAQSAYDANIQSALEHLKSDYPGKALETLAANDPIVISARIEWLCDHFEDYAGKDGCSLYIFKERVRLFDAIAGTISDPNVVNMVKLLHVAQADLERECERRNDAMELARLIENRVHPETRETIPASDDYVRPEGLVTQTEIDIYVECAARAGFSDDPEVAAAIQAHRDTLARYEKYATDKAACEAEQERLFRPFVYYKIEYALNNNGESDTDTDHFYTLSDKVDGDGFYLDVHGKKLKPGFVVMTTKREVTSVEDMPHWCPTVKLEWGTIMIPPDGAESL